MYGAKVIAAFEALPLASAGREETEDEPNFQHSSIRNRAERYAQLSGDVPLRLRILQSDLSSIWRYEALVAACLEASREREA